ncbi:threonine/serine ThrE exporter family protein [Orrella daihaiensis]|uniref:Threonine/serine exporter family protein n=1 Tax=Orrella daihaiensis TaxID=2782176 RepID=A0ABY4AQE4_9BURK|nr:threonine/serine exporter family protein [Orrella daihaiensis]UOD51280.1 threonine/serine exporter family protein [Orrella daihaiensis]
MASDLVDCLKRAVILLHANGQTTQRLIEDTTRLARAGGIEWQIVPQWDGVFCRWRQKDSQNWDTAILSVRPAGVDMHKVAQTNHVIDLACADKERLTGADLEALDRQLTEIEQYPPSTNIRFVVMAGLGASALGLIFGVADSLVLALIFVTAMLGAAVRRLLAHYSDNLLVQPFVAALIAGVCGGIAQGLFDDPRVQFVVIAPCMILVPGAHILNASLDLVRGRLGLGVSRFAYCALILLAICAGLLIGLAGTHGTLSSAASAVHTPLWIDIVCAGVAVAAFGAFFSLPWGLLAAPVIVGMACHGSRWLVLESGGGVVSATLVACLISGCVMTILARKLKLPFAALAFASVVSMMPGIFVFKFAAGLVDIYDAGSQATLTMLLDTVTNGTGAFMIVMAMTFGLIVPKMLIEGVVYKNR